MNIQLHAHNTLQIVPCSWRMMLQPRSHSCVSSIIMYARNLSRPRASHRARRFTRCNAKYQPPAKFWILSLIFEKLLSHRLISGVSISIFRKHYWSPVQYFASGLLNTNPLIQYLEGRESRATPAVRHMPLSGGMIIRQLHSTRWRVDRYNRYMYICMIIFCILYYA